MGRYAQRRVAGGGPSFGLIAIGRARQIGAADTLDVTYTGNVKASTFVPAAFFLPDDSGTGTAIAQFSPNTLRVTFDILTDVQTILDYNGATIGILTPQSVTIG